MKKRISLFLTVVLLISAVAMFASCSHECTFATEWTIDANNHWHVCEDEKCDLTTTPEAHTWDGGKITTKATQEAAGVKTFTCTVCVATKTESVEFVGLSEEDWNAVISAESFQNYSMVMTTNASAAGIVSTTSVSYKIGDDKVYMRMEMLGQVNEQTIDDPEEVAESKQEMVDAFIESCKYEDFTYDADAKLYRANKKVSSIDGTQTDNATMKFANGNLVELKYIYTTEQSGISVDVEITLVFSDYGTTVVE